MSTVILALALASSLGAATERTVDSQQSTLEVVVTPAGPLKSRLHTHRFQPKVFRGAVAVDPAAPEAASVRLEVDATSLVEAAPGLDPKDQQKVEVQVRGPEVLDAKTYPTLSFASKRFTVKSRSPQRLEGTLVGTLTLRGQSREVSLPLSAELRENELRARGTARFKQSDFGIRPLHKALGAIQVKDEVELRFDVVAR